VHTKGVAERITRCIDDLQAVIDEMRLTIFNLAHSRDKRPVLSQRLQEAVARLTENQTITTSVRMSGPVNVVTGDLADDVEAVVVEALSNAVRHSGAAAITIEISVDDDLSLDIRDDGCGIPEDNHRKSGLANMARRAQQHGGDCEIASPADGGTRIRWRAPLLDHID
jgi:signal transduction histidine kinase